MRWFPRYVRLSLPRLWMRDVVYFGMRSFIVGGITSVQVSSVMEARRNSQPLISWAAILIKAIALNSRKWPQLRRAYISFPWPHLYEHPHCVATIVIEREWQGERAVFFDQIPAPEHKSLREIDHLLKGSKMLGIELVGSYRRLLRITRYPLPIRRLIWLIALRGAGRLKSKYFGTFSVNSIGSRYNRTTQSVTPVSQSLEYGPVEPNGRMPIRFYFDHRVMDGQTLVRIGRDLESVLNNEIVEELNAAA